MTRNISREFVSEAPFSFSSVTAFASPGTAQKPREFGVGEGVGAQHNGSTSH